MGSFLRFLCWGLLCASLLASQAAAAQPAYQGPPGATVFAKARQLEAAGNKVAAATAYQQAYEAYRSVDDSDGMIRALAAKKAAEGGAPAAVAPAAAPRPLAAARPVSAARPASAPVPPAAGGTPVQPLAGRVAGGRPLGLFFMTRYQMAFRSLEKASYYFTPSGQVYVDPTGFSAAELAAVPASSRGTYSHAGSTLTVRWANGQTESSTVEPQATTFGWNMGIFLAVRPFASAQQLQGSFEGGNSVSTSGGGASNSSSFTFRPDGTFSRSSAGSVSSTGSGTTARAGGSSAGAGRWQLSGWLLTLADANGQTRRGVAYPIETDSKTGQVTRFYFDGIAYKRQ
jgi:hypothetical protein